MKTCSKCQRVLATNDFYKHSSARDGLRSQCKSCYLKKCADWRHANAEKIARFEHSPPRIERRKADRRAWHQANAEYVRAKKKIYRATHRDYIAGYMAEWRLNNRELAAAHKLTYYAKHYDKIELKRRRIVEDISDTYVKGMIRSATGISSSQITQDIVEAKRLHLKLTRLIKEKRK